MQNSDSHRSCFGPVTGIKGGLATAAQFLRTIYRMPQALEDTDHADAHLRKKEIHETGNKQGYGHLAWSEASRQNFCRATELIGSIQQQLQLVLRFVLFGCS